MSAACNAPEFRSRRTAPSRQSWIIALTVTLATFMEVLDTSIANVALPHIAGSLWRQRGRKHLGSHFVSCFECYRAADERLVFLDHRAQAFLHVVRRAFHHQFFLLRTCA